MTPDDLEQAMAALGPAPVGMAQMLDFPAGMSMEDAMRLRHRAENGDAHAHAQMHAAHDRFVSGP